MTNKILLALVCSVALITTTFATKKPCDFTERFDSCEFYKNLNFAVFYGKLEIVKCICEKNWVNSSNKCNT